MNQQVAIIGGGLTGLVAAYRLRQSGHQVTIYEAGPELGGLAASFEIEGTPIEKAYHHLFRTDTAIIELIRELGIEHLLEWHPSSVSIYRDDRIWPFMSPVDLLRFQPSSFLGRLRTGLVALYLQKSSNWKSLAPQSALSWMTRYCGKSATAAIWAPLLKGKFAKHAQNISMAWLWARLHVRANSREPGKGEQLGYIRGGFVEIINRLAEKLQESGVTIHCNTPVSAIRRHESKVEVIVNGSHQSYDAVLHTGSSKTMMKLIDPSFEKEPYFQKLKSIDYLGAVCYVFTSSQSLAKQYWININQEDAPFLVFIQHTNLIPANHYNGKHVYYIGAYLDQSEGLFTQDDDKIIQLWQHYLKQIFPEFDRHQLDQQFLFRFRDAQHIVDCSYSEKLTSYATPIKGLYLSNFSQIYPEDRGTNFAVREGNQVAHKILESLDQSNQSPDLHCSIHPN